MWVINFVHLKSVCNKLKRQKWNVAQFTGWREISNNGFLKYCSTFYIIESNWSILFHFFPTFTSFMYICNDDYRERVSGANGRNYLIPLNLIHLITRYNSIGFWIKSPVVAVFFSQLEFYAVNKSTAMDSVLFHKN